MTFRIVRPDKKNWVLEEWAAGGINRKTGLPSPGYWKTFGYYGKIEDLAKYLLNHQIELPDGTLQNQVRDLLAGLDQLEARLVQEIRAAEPERS